MRILTAAVVRQSFYTEIDKMDDALQQQRGRGTKLTDKIYFTFFVDEHHHWNSRQISDKCLLLAVGEEITRTRHSIGQSLLFSQDIQKKFVFAGDRINIGIINEFAAPISIVLSEMVSVKTMMMVIGRSTKGSNVSRFLIKNQSTSKTIFMSSDREKALYSAGIHDGDVLEIVDIKDTSNDRLEVTPTKTKAKPKRTQKKANRSPKKKPKSKSRVVIKTAVDHKVEHSKFLTLVFEEADPKFRDIRLRLNAMMIKKEPKSTKVTANKPQLGAEGMSFAGNDNSGKAGKSIYNILVGERDNLYLSTKKKAPQCNTGSNQSISIDLHGCTKDKAIGMLDSALPVWVDFALTGSYPWVVKVDVICGGGNQILSEAVEKWIKEQKNVAQRPKSFY